MNRGLLEKPFDPGQIKQREGNFGKKLDYIESRGVHRNKCLKKQDILCVLCELSGEY